MKLKEAKIGFGNVVCIPAVPEVPETRETIGNTTNIYGGTPAKDAYCDVRFMVTCEYEPDGPMAETFFLSIRLSGDKSDLPYSQVEAEASRLVAPMLRDAADRIERQVAAYDESRRIERGES